MTDSSFYTSQLEQVKRCKARILPIKGLNDASLCMGFTTRFGGVSEAPYNSLNLNFFREDDPEAVRQNFELFSEDVGVSLEAMVLSRQVHSSRIIRVGSEHKGMGILRDRSYGPVDGVATEEKNLMLVSYYAACVALYFYDPQKNAICLSHSGWKGTLQDIAGASVGFMAEAFGSRPEDIMMSFGPHIGSCCFEVGDDVAEAFFSTYSWSKDSACRNQAGKWMLDLEAIITGSLIQKGLKKENITGCPICTRCEHEVFFSHRGSGGKTGTGAAFLMMRG